MAHLPDIDQADIEELVSPPSTPKLVSAVTVVVFVALVGVLVTELSRLVFGLAIPFDGLQLGLLVIISGMPVISLHLLSSRVLRKNLPRRIIVQGTTLHCETPSKAFRVNLLQCRWRYGYASCDPFLFGVRWGPCILIEAGTKAPYGCMACGLSNTVFNQWLKVLTGANCPKGPKCQRPIVQLAFALAGGGVSLVLNLLLWSWAAPNFRIRPVISFIEDLLFLASIITGVLCGSLLAGNDRILSSWKRLYLRRPTIYVVAAVGPTISHAGAWHVAIAFILLAAGVGVVVAFALRTIAMFIYQRAGWVF